MARRSSFRGAAFTLIASASFLLPPTGCARPADRPIVAAPATAPAASPATSAPAATQTVAAASWEPETLRFLAKATRLGWAGRGELLLLTRWMGGGRFEAPRYIAISVERMPIRWQTDDIRVAVGRTYGDDLFVTGRVLSVSRALLDRGVPFNHDELKVTGMRDAQFGEEADLVLQVKVDEGKFELVRVSIAGEQIRIR